jgi:FkbM family methyltransferase
MNFRNQKQLREEVWYALSLMYSRVYKVTKNTLGFRIRGLGFLLRRLKHSRTIEVDGRVLYFEPKLATSYSMLVSGSWNEPETHVFLKRLIPALRGHVCFIDVGANIGEMVVDVSRYENISRVIAFEPIEAACIAIGKSLALNRYERYELVNKLVGDIPGIQNFREDARNSGGSSVFFCGDNVSMMRSLPVTTLDESVMVRDEIVVLLIDVEGFEPQVLKGARMLVETHKPVIILEYNYVSKMRFNISDIAQILGPNYRIYRLREDGRLDDNVEAAWNCVAFYQGGAPHVLAVSSGFVQSGSIGWSSTQSG